MGVYDENMFQLNYTWGIHSDEHTQGGYEYSIDFDGDDNVYMLGNVDYEFHYIAYMDADLNKIAEVYIKEPDIPLGPRCLIALPEGGCLVSSSCYYSYDGYIHKITLSDLLDIEEAHSNGFAMAVAYPNPGKDILNIRTALQNARVVICDLNGKMVYNQEITDNITPITTTSWSSGTYIWKVIANGKEAEFGKWIKQ
jgi:hypothetical protein